MVDPSLDADLRDAYYLGSRAATEAVFGKDIAERLSVGREEPQIPEFSFGDGDHQIRTPAVHRTSPSTVARYDCGRRTA